MMNLKPLFIIIIGMLFCIQGCQTIEHRSEKIERIPLAPLPKNNKDPKVLWSNHASSGIGKMASSYKIANNDQELFIADHQGKIVSINKSSGKKRLEIKSKSKIISGPSIFENYLLVGSDDGRVLAFDITNEKLLWQTSLTGAPLAAPYIKEGKVFVNALDGSVTALNLVDGQLLWQHQSHSPSLILRKGSTPVIVNNHLLVGLSSGKVLSLDKTDGQVQWEQEVALSKGRSEIQRMVDITADPVVFDNMVYVVSYQGSVMALSLETGSILWEKPMSSYSGLTVSKDALFVTDTSGIVWAFNPKTGSLLWDNSALKGRQLTAPTVVNNVLALGDDEGNLHFLNKIDGSLMARTLVDKKGIEATPLVQDNNLYVLSRGGKMVRYQPSW